MGNCHYNSVVPLDLKMTKELSFPMPPKETTQFIKNHRERMLFKANRAEKRREKARKLKEAEEKEKKRLEELEQKQEEKNYSQTSSELIYICGEPSVGENEEEIEEEKEKLENMEKKDSADE